MLRVGAVTFICIVSVTIISGCARGPVRLAKVADDKAASLEAYNGSGVDILSVNGMSTREAFQA